MGETDMIYSFAGSLLPGACTGGDLSNGKKQGPADPPEETARPNSVIMLAGDCSFNDLGCYGSPDAITPDTDRLTTKIITIHG